MRSELLKILEIDRTYVVQDFDYVHSVALRLYKESVNDMNRKYKDVENEQPDLVDDIMDDLVWYRQLENFFIWHFALCRLQAIFEGYIVNSFLSSEFKKGGLKSKLTELKRFGYRVSSIDYNKLLEWGQIRNALSHFPPEKYSDGILRQGDIEEYMELCKNVITELEEQKLKRLPS